VSDSRFSGQPNPNLSGNDPFGYFGGPPAGTSGPSTFGGAIPPGPGTGVNAAQNPEPTPYTAAPPAQTPFGTVPPTGATPFGAAPFGQPFQQPAATTASRGLSRSALFTVVAAVLVVVLGYGGWTLYQRHSQGLNVPITLAGMARDTEPATVNAERQLQTQLSQIKSDGVTKTAVQAYGSSALRHVSVLILARANQTIDAPSLQAGLFSQAMWGTPAASGSSTCATSADHLFALCYRVDGNLMVIAMDVESTASPAAAAAMVDEAQSQQP